MPTFEQRAIDPVGRMFMRDLIVPKLFIDAPWPKKDQRVDLVAIDRAGKGDVHAVELGENVATQLRSHERVKAITANYLWIAFPSATIGPKNLAKLLYDERLFLSDGKGRIGVIEVVTRAGDELTANVVLRAERIPGSLAKARDDFIASHGADWES